FWAGIAATAPTVVTAKVAYDIGHLADDIRVAGHQVVFQPGQRDIMPAYLELGAEIKAIWSTWAAMGPEPLVALADAMTREDTKRVAEIWDDITSLPPGLPLAERERFREFNAQLCGEHNRAAGYIRSGPTRAPYRDLPELWREVGNRYGRAWAVMRE